MSIQAIFGVSGKLCSGKSRLAAAVVKADPRYQLHGFARALKADVERLTGVQITDENKAIFRPLLQAYGTTMQGLHGKEYWVHRALRDAAFGWLSHVIFDDVRFPHEVEALRAYGQKYDVPVFVARLDIGPETQAERHLAKYGCLPDPELLLHPSETALDDYPAFDFRMDGVYAPRLLDAALAMSLKLSNVPFTPSTATYDNIAAQVAHE